MGALPPEIVRVLRVFEDVFSGRVWDWVRVLAGGRGDPGTGPTDGGVGAADEGLSEERQFRSYQRVLNRGCWSSRPVRPGAATRARDQGAATRRRRAAADVGGAPARSGHDLGDADHALGRRRDRPGGGGDRRRPLVPPRRPARRAPPGAAARSGRPVRAACPPQDRPDQLTSPDRRLGRRPLPVRQATRYAQPAPTCSDTLAFVRQLLWPLTVFSTSPSSDDVIEIPRARFDRLADTLAFAARAPVTMDKAQLRAHRPGFTPEKDDGSRLLREPAAVDVSGGRRVSRALPPPARDPARRSRPARRARIARCCWRRRAPASASSRWCCRRCAAS